MIRYRTPDKAKARSMISAAENEITFIKTIPPMTASASIIIRTIYESFRMLGDALLLLRGKEAVGQDHHKIMIEELLTLSVQTTRRTQALLNLKDLRHRINYNGYIPAPAEAIDALSIADGCFQPLAQKIREEYKI